jgi:histone H4
MSTEAPTEAPASSLPVASTDCTVNESVPVTAAEIASEPTLLSGSALQKMRKSARAATKKSGSTSRKEKIRKAHKVNPPVEHLLRGPAIKRLARRAGVKRMSDRTYNAARLITCQFLKRVVNHAVLVMKHADRKTVKSVDVMFALQQLNRAVY